MGIVTVMELLRSSTTSAEEGARRPRWRAAGAGAATAAAGLLVVVLLLTLGLLAVPRATAGAGEALGLGSIGWLVLGGARVEAGANVVAFTPLVGPVLLVLLARVGARRGLPASPGLPVQGAWLGGYVAVGLVATLLGLLTPLSPAPLHLVLPLLLVPCLALLWAHGVPERARPTVDRVPAAVRRGALPGAKGAVVALAAGCLLTMATVAINFGRVGHVQSALEAGFFGGLVLVLLQLMLLPNLGIWALSFAAGPGFATTDRAMTTWSGAESGVLPMIPVLAGQPQPGPLHWSTHLLVIVPVLIGAWTAREALRSVPRLAATRTKLRAVGAAVLVAALTVAVVDALAGGSLGSDRLADVGAPAVTLAWVLVLELGLGAAVVVGRDWWVLRR